MSEFGEVVHPVGRKEYYCEWCGEKILKEEKHAHYTGKWENEFQDWRMHEECYAASCKEDDLIDGFVLYSYARGTGVEK